MKEVKVYLKFNQPIKFGFSFKDDWGVKKHCDAFNVRTTGGRNVYLMGLKETDEKGKYYNYKEVVKRMFFREDSEGEGSVYVKFNKDEVDIGRYKEVYSNSK